LGRCLDIDEENAIALVRLMNVKIQQQAIEEAQAAIDKVSG